MFFGANPTSQLRFREDRHPPKHHQHIVLPSFFIHIFRLSTKGAEVHREHICQKQKEKKKSQLDWVTIWSHFIIPWYLCNNTDFFLSQEWFVLVWWSWELDINTPQLKFFLLSKQMQLAFSKTSGLVCCCLPGDFWGIRSAPWSWKEQKLCVAKGNLFYTPRLAQYHLSCPFSTTVWPCWPSSRQGTCHLHSTCQHPFKLFVK